MNKLDKVKRIVIQKTLKLDCGTNSLHHVLRKYGQLKNLNGLEYSLNKGNKYGTHPLLQLQPDQLPDVISHQLELFNLR